MHGSSGLQRFGAALAAALMLHAGLALFAVNADVRPLLPEVPRDPIEVTPWEPPEAVPPPEPPPEDAVDEPPEEAVDEPPVEKTVEPPPEPPPPEPEKVEPPEPPPAPEDAAPPEPLPEDAVAPEDAVPPETVPDAPAAAPAPLPEVVEKDTPSPEDAPIVRLPAGPRRGTPSLMGRVLGRGSDPFGTKLKTYESALEFKADGPMSDKVRAERMASRMIQHEMAADAVSAGLADDYFRELKERLEHNWRPKTRDLNDGGESTKQLGFLKDFTVNRAAWGEVFRLYLDMANQYGEGRDVRVDRGRLARARELFRSKKGNFRMQAIAEVILTQAADGKMLTLEFATPTGHNGIDEGIKNAFQTALAIMPYKPPERLSFGRAFRSKWRMRATWRMVPPTALLTGSGWDISQNGVEVDVPFDVKLQTKIMLQSFDNRSSNVGSF
jgi:hypothetical protein